MPIQYPISECTNDKLKVKKKQVVWEKCRNTRYMCHHDCMKFQIFQKSKKKNFFYHISRYVI